MDYTLTMTFLTSGGKKSTFSISGIKPDITKEEIKTLMNTIIEKNVFFAQSGALVAISAAQVTQKKVTKFEVA